MNDAASPQPRVAAGSAFLTHANGLHARPAVALIRTAKRFTAAIRVGRTADGPWTDAKSVVGIMAMKAPSGVPIFFEATGADASAAVAALVALVTSDFGGDAESAPR